MADNISGVHHGGPYRYGPQPGMTFDSDELTVLRYTNPKAARLYEIGEMYMKVIRKKETQHRHSLTRVPRFGRG